MNILVVGGSGYIASHVGCLFGRRGVDVVTLDNLFVDHPDAMTKHVVDKFTLASTATIFGEPKSPPLIKNPHCNGNLTLDRESYSLRRGDEY
jgi:UDP-glucose 4-epimerase